jgi:glycosyltransferase involved in cell wall biosynthesis
MTVRPMLSVVVPVHNASHQLACCLQALRASSFRDFELLVVDDCSTDSTPQVIYCHDVRYVRTPHRMGPAGARNWGARHARGRILVFVDADVQVPPDALDLIAGNFARDPRLAAVFGSYDQEPVEPDFFSQYKNLIHHYVHQHSRENAASFWTGCGAIRKDLFAEFRGFNVRRFPRPAIEDIELGHRLRAAGHKVLLDKRLQVKHLKRWTLVGMLKSDIRDRAVPWSKLILNSGEIPRDLNLTYAARFSAVGTLLLAVVALALSLSAGLPRTSVLMLTCGGLATVLALIAANYGLYGFFWKHRGFAFAVAAMPIHWLYYFYSGLVWIGCWTAHHLGAAFRPSSMALAMQLQRLGQQNWLKRSASDSQCPISEGQFTKEEALVPDKFQRPASAEPPCMKIA